MDSGLEFRHLAPLEPLPRKDEVQGSFQAVSDEQSELIPVCNRSSGTLAVALMASF